MGFPSQTPVWDPTTLLGIINTEVEYHTITCLGHAPTQRRRCRMKIRAENRTAITRILKEISMLNQESEEGVSKLRTIAGLGLCGQYHSGQVGTLVEGWRNVVSGLGGRKRIGGSGNGRGGRCVVVEEEEEVDRKDYVGQDILLKELRDLMEKLRRDMQLQEECRNQQGQPQREKRGEDVKVKARRVDTLSKEEFGRSAKPEVVKDWERKGKQCRLEKERKVREEELQRRWEEEEREEQKRKKETEAEEQRKREEKQRQDEKIQHAERIRQKAQTLREERAREANEKVKKEREEWDQSWMTYQIKWESFRPSVSMKHLKSSIPWPVKTGLYGDVNETNVKMFMTTAGPRDEGLLRLMRQECLKWHSDKVNLWAQNAELTDVDRSVLAMICLELTALINEAGRK